MGCATSRDIDVVKSSFIFGGNASGKSNVIRAFQLLRAIIVHGTSSELEALFWTIIIILSYF